MTNRFKEAIRVSSRQLRSQLPLEYQKNHSVLVCKQIKQLELYRYARHIALYQANNNEISLESIWRSAPMQGKFCYFPVITEEKTLVFLPATPVTPFVRNRFGIAEPDVPHSKAIPINQLDIIFMPLVAFDPHKTRIGMGAGFYDKTLEGQTHPSLIGVAYEFQHCPYIAPDPWDIRLNAVITEINTYL